MTILDIDEMSCEHCVKRIHETLLAENIKHEVNLGDKTVIVDGNQEEVTRAISELEDIGFTARER